MSSVLEEFAASVGADGPVCPVGGRTQWSVGGLPVDGVRPAAAPSGVVAHSPGEMIVRVRAGTTLAELASVVAAGGQEVALESADPTVATVGGVLAVGQSGVRRLGRGPVRDAVLEVTAVNSRGELIRAGGPLVKNVTGFDLCRLFVGSLGTLGVLAEVVLRCRPVSELEAWWVAEGVDPFGLAARLYRPLAVLWDGAQTWVGLSGYAIDVRDQAASVLGGDFEAVDGPPALPGPARRSLAPAALRGLTGSGWVAEIGVGVVHGSDAAAEGWPHAAEPDPAVIDLHGRLKARFDPTGRLNPGRSVLAVAAS